MRFSQSSCRLGLGLSLALTLLIGNASLAVNTRGRRIDTAFRLFHGNVSIDTAAGERALLVGNYEEATADFRKALKKNAKDVSAIGGLGFALALQYKLDGADQQFDKAIKLKSKDPLAHVGKAFVKLSRLQTSNMTVIRQKDSILNSAEQDCQLALQQDPGMPEAHLVLGMIKKEQGNLNDAIQNYSKAIEGDPKFGVAFTRRGLAYVDQGNYPSAEQDLKQAISLRSSDASAHFGLGRVYLAQGKIDESLQELNTALSLNRNSAPIHIALGDAYRQQGNTVASLSEYMKAVNIKAENSDAYLKIADIYDERGDLEMSLADLRSGLALNPNSEALHRRVADTNLRLEKNDDAIKEYNAALNLSPGDVEAVKGLTRAYLLKSQKEASGAFFASNNYEDAAAVIAKAIQLNPNDLELRLADAKFRAMSGQPVDLSKLPPPSNDAERIAYSEALLAQFRYNEATQAMQTVIANQSDPKQLFAVADLSLMIHDLDSANFAYKKAGAVPGNEGRAKRGVYLVGKAKSDAQKSLNLASDLSKRKQYASGIDNYRNAAYLNPRLPDAHYGLAEALRKYYSKSPAKLREASAQYKAYLSLAPNLPEKDREKIQKTADKCVEKAYNLERKGKGDTTTPDTDSGN
jgi:tetratricopeptide (TPR) repeat protein